MGKKAIAYANASAKDQLFKFSKSMVLMQAIKSFRGDVGVAQVDTANIGSLPKYQLDVLIGEGFAGG